MNETSLNIIKILYHQGAIRTYLIKKDKILIYFKYYLRKVAISISMFPNLVIEFIEHLKIYPNFIIIIIFLVF